MSTDFMGIHVGGSYACVAVASGKSASAQVIANDHGSRITPCIVAYNETEMCLGDTALSQASKNIRNTVFHMKHMLGRNMDDPVIKSLRPVWKFRLADGEETSPVRVEVDFKGSEKIVSPEELCSIMFQKMRETATAYVGKKITKAVVTVPYDFTAEQKQALFAACKQGGVECVRMISEPAAAALAYDLHETSTDRRNVMVFDMGGRSLCVSILRCDSGSIEVLSSLTKHNIGGEIFTEKICEHCATVFKRKSRVDLSEYPRSMRKLFDAAEHAKRTLSTAAQATVEVESLYEGQDLSVPLSRAKFEDMISELCNSAVALAMTCIENAQLPLEELDDVLLVGGATRVPKIVRVLSEKLGREPQKTHSPEEVAATGAAVQGALLQLGGKKALATPTITTEAKPITSMPLGIIAGDKLVVMMDAKTVAPASHTINTTTASAADSSLLITIGEDRTTLGEGIITLAKLPLFGIKPEEGRPPHIAVTFSVTLDGHLTVTAEQTSSGAKASITVNHEVRNLAAEAAAAAASPK